MYHNLKDFSFTQSAVSPSTSAYSWNRKKIQPVCIVSVRTISLPNETAFSASPSHQYPIWATQLFCVRNRRRQPFEDRNLARDCTGLMTRNGSLLERSGYLAISSSDKIRLRRRRRQRYYRYVHLSDWSWNSTTIEQHLEARWPDGKDFRPLRRDDVWCFLLRWMSLLET